MSSRGRRVGRKPVKTYIRDPSGNNKDTPSKRRGSASARAASATPSSQPRAAVPDLAQTTVSRRPGRKATSNAPPPRPTTSAPHFFTPSSRPNSKPKAKASSKPAPPARSTASTTASTTPAARKYSSVPPPRPPGPRPSVVAGSSKYGSAGAPPAAASGGASAEPSAFAVAKPDPPVVSAQDQVAACLLDLFAGKLPPSRQARLETYKASAGFINGKVLDELSRMGHWRFVLTSVEKRLTEAFGGTSSSPSLDNPTELAGQLILQNYRLTALVRLREFQRAAVLGRALDELVPRAESVTDVPFNLKLQLAALPFHLGEAKSAISRLTKLLDSVQTQVRVLRADPTQFAPDKVPSLSNTLQEQWRRIASQLISIYMHIKDYATCIKLLRHFLKRFPDDSAAVCQLGRLCLQLGDVRNARLYFDEFARLSPSSSTDVELNRALVHVAESNFDEACTVLEPLVAAQPENVDVVNNFAVASLYVNEIGRAVETLEQLVARDPLRFTTEAVVSNLWTLYSLSSFRPQIKQQVLQKVLDRYAPDDFDQSVLPSS